MINAVARVVFKVGGHAGSAAAAATGWPGGSDDVGFRCVSLQNCRVLARPTLYLTPPAKLSRERPTSISTPAVSTAKLPSFRPPSPTQTSPTLPQSYTAVSSSSFVLLDQRLALAAAPLLHLTAARVIANPIVWANRLAAACSKNLEGQVGNFGWGKMVVYL